MANRLESHPHTPAVIPPLPEHVLPDAPMPHEEAAGILQCLRCGRVVWSIAADGFTARGRGDCKVVETIATGKLPRGKFVDAR